MTEALTQVKLPVPDLSQLISNDPANSPINKQTTVNLCEVAFPAHKDLGLPLTGITTERRLDSVTIADLKELDLNFFRTFTEDQLPYLEQLLSYPGLTRLMGVTQMQYSYSVAGAGHNLSRYIHVLGAAEEVYEAILEINKAAYRDSRFVKIDEQTAQLAVIAALLHDYSHGPFSHVFEHVAKVFQTSSKYDHDHANQENILNDKGLGRILRSIDVDPKEVVRVLNPNDKEYGYLYKLVKVFGDRLSYLRTDFVGHDFINGNSVGNGKIDSITDDVTEAVKQSMRVIQQQDESGSKTSFNRLVFSDCGGEVLPHVNVMAELMDLHSKSSFFNSIKGRGGVAVDLLFRVLRKTSFIEYCMSPESVLAAAIVGRSLKQYATTLAFNPRLVHDLVVLNDHEFIQELSTAADVNPDIKNWFFGEKKLDEYFDEVVSFKHDNNLYSDLLIQDQFRKDLRKHLNAHESFRIPADYIFASHPLGEDNSFHTSVLLLNPQTFQADVKEIAYDIPDKDLSFTVYIGREYTKGDPEILEALRVEIEDFIENYNIRNKSIANLK